MIVCPGIGDYLVLSRKNYIEEGMGKWDLNRDRLKGPKRSAIDRNARNQMTMKNVFPRLDSESVSSKTKY